MYLYSTSNWTSRPQHLLSAAAEHTIIMRGGHRSSSSSSRAGSCRCSRSMLLLLVFISCNCLQLGPTPTTAARELFAAVSSKPCNKVCSRRAPLCIQGQCQPCRNTQQCIRVLGRSNLICDRAAKSPTMGQCIASKCTANSQCTGSAGSYCNKSTGKCVQCLAHPHCQSVIAASEFGKFSAICTNNVCIKQVLPLSGSVTNSSSNTTDRSDPPSSPKVLPSSNQTQEQGNGSQPLPPTKTTEGGSSLNPASDPATPTDAGSSNSSRSGDSNSTDGSGSGTPARECNTNADCPRSVTWDMKGPRCSAEGQCVQCNVDRDCPATGLLCVGKCDVCVANSCVHCRVDDDCEGKSGLEGQGPYCMAGSCKVKGKKCSSDAECKPTWQTCMAEPCPEPKCGLDGYCDSGLDGL